MTARVVRAARIAFALSVVVHAALLVRGLHQFLLRPFIEDSFYTLAVARSLARGTGWSMDGVHPTNGLQPLIALIDAPAFLIGGGDTLTALRLVLLVQIAFFALVAWQFGVLVERLMDGPAGTRWVVAALVIANYTFSALFLNGLETGLVVWLVLLVLTRLDRLREGGPAGVREGLWLGGLLGLAVLARIDSVALIPIAMLGLWWAPGDATRPARVRLNSIAALTVTALAVSLPWWVYNVHLTGSPMPSSGQALQLSAVQHPRMLVASTNVLMTQLLLFLHTGYGAYRLSFVGLAALAVFLGLAVAAWRVSDGHAWWSRRFIRWMPMFLFSGALVGMYTWVHRAPHFQARYLAVPRLAVLALALLALYGALSRWRWGRRALLALGAVWIGASLALSTRNFSSAPGNEMVAVADWIESHIEPGARIGMFQSGTTGFLFPDRIVNLDGKVNVDVLEYHRNDNLDDYIVKLELDYVIDWPEYLELGFHMNRLYGEYRCIETIAGRFEVWKRASN